MQDELRLDQARAWDRRVREKSNQYAAFVIYRDLGPNRTLAGAYRQARAADRAQPELIDSSAPSAAWKRWYKQNDWDKRAQAWDQWRREEKEWAEREVEEKIFWKKLEQRRALDEIKFNRILAIHSQIDEILRNPTGLTRSRQTSEVEGKQMMIEVDRPRQFEILSEKLDSLEDRYFSGMQSALEPSEPPGATDYTPGAPVVSEFVWVPDPEMAELEAKAAEKPKPAKASEEK